MVLVGVDYPHFFQDTDRTMMLSSDTRQDLREIVEAIKNG